MEMRKWEEEQGEQRKVMEGSVDTQSNNFVASVFSFPKHYFFLLILWRRQRLAISTLFYGGADRGPETMSRYVSGTQQKMEP